MVGGGGDRSVAHRMQEYVQIAPVEIVREAFHSRIFQFFREDNQCKFARVSGDISYFQEISRAIILTSWHGHPNEKRRMCKFWPRRIIMQAWWHDLTARERRTMAACFGGWSLDAFDVQIYSFTIPALVATWGLTQAQAGYIGTVALLFSAAGGWIAGALSDRFGRVKTLQITVAWFAIFTFLSGFAENYYQLLILRSLQGL